MIGVGKNKFGKWFYFKKEGDSRYILYWLDQSEVDCLLKNDVDLDYIEASYEPKIGDCIKVRSPGVREYVVFRVCEIRDIPWGFKYVLEGPPIYEKLELRQQDFDEEITRILDLKNDRNP